MANTKSLDLELSSSQYASIADASQTGLDITGDISVVAWIDLEELPSTATTDFTIIGKWTSASGKRSYLFWIESGDDKLYFRYSDDGEFTSAVTTLVSTTALGAGYVAAWNHVAVTVDVSAATGKFYFNGTEEAANVTASDALSIFNGTAPFAIGASETDATPAQKYDGLIDEVGIYSAILAQSDIDAIYAGADQTDRANQVAYWKLNDDYLDVTANNNDLTASGSPVFSASVPFADYSGGAATTNYLKYYKRSYGMS